MREANATRGGAEPAPVPTSGAEASEIPPHPVLAAFRETLKEWLSEEERTRLAEVSMTGTMGGDSQRLRYIAADRTIRVFLPLALEAQDAPQLAPYADALRALPPLLNRDTDLVARPIVAEAMGALQAVRRGESLTPAVAPEGGVEGDSEGVTAPTAPAAAMPSEESLAIASAETVDPEEARAYADALAEYAEAYSAAYGVDALHADAATAAAADAVDAGFLVRQTVEEYGADREQVVGHALDLLGEMAAAARRRERMPRTRHEEEVRDDGPQAAAPGTP